MAPGMGETCAAAHESLISDAKTDSTSSCAERLRAVLKSRSITAHDLASGVGCTDVAISKILHGVTRRSRLLPDIASWLNVDYDWLRGSTADGHAALPRRSELERIFLKLLNLLPAQSSNASIAAFLSERLPGEIEDASPRLAASTTASNPEDAIKG